jgi:hypothetical protein
MGADYFDCDKVLLIQRYVQVIIGKYFRRVRVSDIDSLAGYKPALLLQLVTKKTPVKGVFQCRGAGICRSEAEIPVGETRAC